MLYIGLEVYAGITGTIDGIAHFAHLGGAAVGFAYLLAERKGFSFGHLIPNKKMKYVGGGGRNEFPSFGNTDISDASYFDIREENKSEAEKSVDEILDKINQHGYQSLTEEEKQILNDASKKMN
jgi:hypothetical protein